MSDDKTDKVRYIMRKSNSPGVHGGMGSPVYKLGFWNRIPGAVPGVSQKTVDGLLLDAQLLDMPGEWNEVEKMMDYPITSLSAVYKNLGLPREQEEKIHSMLQAEMETAKRETDIASSLYQQMKITSFPPSLRHRLMVNARKYFNHKKAAEAPTGRERYEFRLNKADTEQVEEPRYVFTIGEE